MARAKKVFLPEQFDKKTKQVVYSDGMYQRIQSFDPHIYKSRELQVDADRRLFFVQTTEGFKTVKHYFNFGELISYELLEDETSVIKGGASIGRALVGGAMLGGAGAIIGGATGKKKVEEEVRSMSIRLSLYNQKYNMLQIVLIALKTKKDSGIYIAANKKAQKMLSALDFISATNQRDSNR